MSVLKSFLFITIVGITSAQSSQPSWNYDNPDDWGKDYSTCDGNRQSPIDLISANAISAPLRPLQFENYNVPLEGRIKLTNNGHSLDLEIPTTINGQRPSVRGGRLSSRYEAVSLHFHWGSGTSKGSEHLINGEAYDAELHIVHKNVLYGTVAEAIKHKDGVVVLGILLEKEPAPIVYYPALYKILRKAPQLIAYNSETYIEFGFPLDNLLGDLYRKEFFTYQGSLTTPPCAEAVTWFVFPDVLPIKSEEINKLFKLLDSRNKTLVDNYRPLQDLNGRKVWYRMNPSGV